MWTYQANPDRTCYICYVILLALQKPAEPAFHCIAPLYNNDGYGLCLGFNSNVIMTFTKIHSVMQYFRSWDILDHGIYIYIYIYH